MEYKIVTDSCSDLTDELKELMDPSVIPFSIYLGEKEFVDNESMDIPSFLKEMKAFPNKPTSACPSPESYLEKFNECKKFFAVTISANLSGSYNSACAAKKIAESENASSGYVVDSKSAACGEFLVTYKLFEMLKNGLSAERVYEKIQDFIKNMKTYFVLDSVDNLVKNGRMNKITGNLISVLNIKPILGSDGEGNIKLFSHARGENQIITRLTDTIGKSGKKLSELEYLVISHCNNPELAQKLKTNIEKLYQFKKIFIVPTKGLSSMYANEKGVILSY